MFPPRRSSASQSHSYDLVVAGLTRKQKAELAELADHPT